MEGEGESWVKKRGAFFVPEICGPLPGTASLRKATTTAIFTELDNMESLHLGPKSGKHTTQMADDCLVLQAEK